MAVDYLFDGHFSFLGQIVKAYNTEETWRTDGTDGYDVLLKEYVTDLKGVLASGVGDVVSAASAQEMTQYFLTLNANLETNQSTLKSIADSYILTELKDALDSGGGSVDDVLEDLKLDMLLSSATVTKNTVTCPAPTRTVGTNTGTGVAKNSPLGDDDTNNNELIQAGVHVLRCIDDTIGGSEVFELRSSQGNRTTLAVAYQYSSSGFGNLVNDGDFEENDGTGPPADTTHWTRSNFAYNTASSTNAYLGEHYLDTVISSLGTAKQDVDNSDNWPKGKLCLINVYVKHTGTAPTLPASGTAMAFKLRDKTAGADIVTMLTLEIGDFAAGYAAKSGWFQMPKDLPDNLEIEISAVVTLDQVVRVDNLAIVAATELDGVKVAVCRGDADFYAGGTDPADHFTFTCTNTNAGVWQTFFTQQYGIALPSGASGSISDTWAQ